MADTNKLITTHDTVPHSDRSQESLKTISLAFSKQVSTVKLMIEAETEIKETVTRFETKLRLEATREAERDQVGVISVIHVKRAMLKPMSFKKNKGKKYSSVIGGILIGAVASNFINILITGILPNTIALGVIIGITFLGATFIFHGLNE